VSKVRGDDFIVTVAVERTQAKLGGSAERVLQELRVTQVFRREGDRWKIVHRHADPLRPTAPPIV
jgi:ketosteroid isomerase-like protein